MRIFKYYNPEYENGIFQNGELNIGTISNFRKIEDDSRKDRNDGCYNFIFMPTSEDIILSNDEVNSMTFNYKIENDRELHIKKNSFVAIALEVLDVYVFCASMSLKQELKDKFGEGVFQIKNIKNFGDNLFRIINQKYPLRFWYSKEVDYVDTKDIIVTNQNKKKGIRPILLDDYFVKTREFEPEDEYRFIFFPQSEPMFKEKIIEFGDLTKIISKI